VFLVYKQTDRVTEPKLQTLDNRRRWSAAKFVAKNQLGDPVAGNLYQVVLLTDSFYTSICIYPLVLQA
jgi:hypothetical protein